MDRCVAEHLEQDVVGEGAADRLLLEGGEPDIAYLGRPVRGGGMLRRCRSSRVCLESTCEDAGVEERLLGADWRRANHICMLRRRRRRLNQFAG